MFMGCMGLIVDILLKISNLNWSLSYCLKVWYIDFFGLKFSNFVLRIVYVIWWWSLNPVSKEFAFINKNFEFVISKSMDEPPSPLKHVFFFTISENVCSWKKDFITLFSTSTLKSPRMITISEKIFVFLGWSVVNRCN